MRRKTIVLAFAALMMATVVQAEVSAYFSQGMTGSYFVPIAQQSSLTNFQTEPLQFNGTMTGQISTFNGVAQTDSNQFVAAESNGVVISNSNRATAGSEHLGSSSATIGNTTTTNLPSTYVYTDQLNQVQTVGNASAQSNGNTLVFVGR